MHVIDVKIAQNLAVATLYGPKDLECMISCDGQWKIEIMNG